MSSQYPSLVISVKAAIEFSKNLFCSFSGGLPSAGSKTLGVVDANTGLNNQMPVIVSGIALVKSGAAVALGAAVSTDAQGRAVTASGSDVINGYALDSATGANQLIRVLLK